MKRWILSAIFSLLSVVLAACASAPVSVVADKRSDKFAPTPIDQGDKSRLTPPAKRVSGVRSTILERGDGWTRMEVEGTVDGRQYPRQVVYRLDGLSGVQNSRLPADVKTMLAHDPDFIKNPGNVIYFGEAAAGAISQFVRDHLLNCRLDLPHGIDCHSPAVDTIVALDTDCPDVDDEKVLPYDLSFSRPVSIRPGMENLNGRVDLVGSVTGPVRARVPYRAKMIRDPAGGCVAGGFTLKPITISGEPQFNLDLTSVSLTVGGEKDFDQTVYTQPLDEVAFAVGPIPVNIDFAFAAMVGVTVGMSGTGKLTLSGGASLPVTFSYTCDRAKNGGNPCTGNAAIQKPVLRPVNLTGFQVSGQGWLKPWFAGLVRVGLYTSVLDNVAIGLAPYVKATLWGTPPGYSQCDLDGNGTIEMADGLLLDADAGLMVKAGVGADWIGVLEQSVPFISNPFFFDLKDLSFHSAFFDASEFLGGTQSKVLTPILHAPTNVHVGESVPIRFKLNDCYPYSDGMTYKVDWGDGHVTPMSFTPHGEASLQHSYGAVGPQDHPVDRRER